MISLRALREKTAWRATAPSILLVLNSLVWYILTYAAFLAIVNQLHLLDTEKLGLFTTYFVGIAISAILGAKFLPHARSKFLNLWSFMGAIATLPLIAVSGNGMLVNALLAFFFGRFDRSRIAFLFKLFCRLNIC